MLSSFLWWS